MKKVTDLPADFNRRDAGLERAVLGAALQSAKHHLPLVSESRRRPRRQRRPAHIATILHVVLRVLARRALAASGPARR